MAWTFANLGTAERTCELPDKKSRMSQTDNPAGDLSAKQRQLEESDLLLSLYRALIESGDPASGLRTALEIVCRFTGWVAGSAWVPGRDGARLQFLTAWHIDDLKLVEFMAACEQKTFPRKLGMPGRVWENQKPEWTRDLAAEASNLFPMAPLAVRAGLSAALCVPIIHEGQVDGVLVFHAREVKDEDDRFVQVVSGVATQLGFALHHKRIEEELRRQDALIRGANERLEQEVNERTARLLEANQMLRAEISTRGVVEDRLEERARQQAAVAEIGRLALGGAEPLAVLQDTSERVTRTLGVEFCQIAELLPDGSGLRLCAGAGWRDGLVGHAILGAGSNSQSGYTLTCSEPVVVQDLSAETRFRAPLLAEHRVVSGMSVVIPGHERAFGVLGAHTLKRRTFRSEDVHFLESVAHILSEAMERARRETALRRSESWLRSLVATTQDAVVSIDRRGRVVLFNAAAERIFGYRAGEIVGQKVNLLMAEPYASEHDDYVKRYERTGQARAIGRIRTVTAKRKDGALFPIELSVTEIAVDDQVHYAAFIRDISEKTRLQEKLLESEKLAAIGNTAAKIAHEIANPLNGIYLTLQLVEQRLLRRPVPDDAALSNIVKIKKEIGRLNQLVRDFRSLARQQTYDFRPLHLDRVIDEVVDLQQPLLQSHGIVIQRSIADDVPVVRVDEDKFKQALLNLIKNAAEAMPGGGVISIAVTRRGDEVVLEVADNGVGIPKGTDVFAPFVTTKKDGTGLGLLIVWQIATAHGGTVSYDSEPGQGTTFRLTLPLSPAQIP